MAVRTDQQRAASPIATSGWRDRLRHRLRPAREKVGSPDLHQAKMRFLVLVACVLYGSYIGVFEGGLTDSQTLVFTLDAVLFGIFALHTYIHFKRNPAPEYCRRSIGLVADHGAALGCLAVTGHDAGALAWLPLFIIQGVGIRFGVRWLFVSQAIGLVSVGLICALNPFFRNNHTVALGAALSVLVLPFYFALLAKREANIKSELVTARQEAEAADEAKGRFVAMVSHELRTPLTGISGLNELLMKQALPQDTKSMLADQHAATQLMLTMVSDVLDLSKIEDGQMQAQAVDFDPQQVALDVFQALSFQADRKGIATHIVVDPSLPARVNGSPFHVTRILQNLLGNAIKFTAEGSVTLRLRMVEAPNTFAAIRFEIEDTGIGMPAEALPKVFDRFYQVDAAITRRFGGTGLGTTIVKELCDLLGGTVAVTSEVGKGSSFIVTLPFAPATSNPESLSAGASVELGEQSPPSPATAGDGSTRAAAPRARLLVAEDTPTIQIFMRATLEDEGFETRIVGDGAEALEVLSHTPFDAIVLDWNMPERDGISVLSELRAGKGPNARTPVVFATAAPSQTLIDSAMRSGAQSVLGKPFAGRQLIDAITTILQPVELRRATTTAAAAPKPDDASSPSLPILDREALEGAGSMLAKVNPRILLDTFSKDLERRKTEFELSVATRDLKLFRSAIHSITGYAGTFGAKRLAQLLAVAPKDQDDFEQHGQASAEAICKTIDLTTAALRDWTNSLMKVAA